MSQHGSQKSDLFCRILVKAFEDGRFSPVARCYFKGSYGDRLLHDDEIVTGHAEAVVVANVEVPSWS